MDAAIGHMKEAQKQENPFSLNLRPRRCPLTLFPSPEKWTDNLKQRYFNVLEEMDAQLGKLFTHVKEDPELSKNTIILITNDNGPSL